MITNAVDTILNPPDYIESRMDSENDCSYNPLMDFIADTAFRGVIVCRDKIPEDGNNMMLPWTNEEIGHAGISNTNTDTSIGTYNENESGRIENGKGYRHVWDFASDRSNGEISSICLTTKDGGKVHTDRKEAGTALREAAVEFMANDNGGVRQPIGTFCGFELSVGKSHSSFGGATAETVIRRGISYTTDMDLTGNIGNTTRLENLFSNGIGKKIVGLEKRAERTNADLQAALANKDKPFEHAEELAQKSARLEQLNLELEVGKADEIIMNESEDEVQGTESHGSHKQDNPNNNRPTPPKHKR